MPEIDNNLAANEGADKQPSIGENSQSGAGQETDKKPDATNIGNGDAGKSEEASAEGDNKDSQNKNAKAQENPPQEGENDDQEPPMRKRLSVSDYIAGRKHAKIAKLKEQVEEEETDEDKIAPEDSELIKRVVSPMIAPFIDKSLAAEDDKEVADFLSNNPDFKSFEAKARRYMAHPSRRQLPVEAIFYEVAGNSLLKIGAERQKAADDKAKNTQTGGGSNRSGDNKKSDWDLSKDEFEAKQEKIRHGL